MFLRTLVFIAVVAGGVAAYYYIDFAPINRVPGSKVIIVGATSGIGKAMAQEFVKRGYFVGIIGRRQILLTQLQQELGERCYSKMMDVTQTEQAQTALHELITTMGGMDILVVNAGVGSQNFAWSEQKKIIDTNVTGFAAMTTMSMDYFTKQGKGHLVGISSIAALHGMGGAPAYSASKAFESNYLQALRVHCLKKNLPITITTIEPGLVDTAMGQSSDFWRSTSQEAATEICDAIERGYTHAYITKRWFLVAWAFKWLPECIVAKLA